MNSYQKTFRFPLIIIIVILLTASISYNSYAQKADGSEKDTPYYKSFSYYTGFAKGDLSGKNDYKIVPSIFRFAFDVDKLGIGAADIVEYVAEKVFNAHDINVKGETEFLAETFLNTIISPDNNIEVGFDILMKYSYPATEKINPYFFVGGGVLYMSQQTNEQSTQYNFIPQMGIGISYDLKENLSFDVEYRYRHLSNANRKLPNDGINVNMFLFGTTWKF